MELRPLTVRMYVRFAGQRMGEREEEKKKAQKMDYARDHREHQLRWWEKRDEKKIVKDCRCIMLR